MNEKTTNTEDLARLQDQIQEAFSERIEAVARAAAKLRHIQPRPKS